MAINKVVYDNNILLDLTEDTVTPNALFNGIKAHDKKGEAITGTLFSGFPNIVSILKVSQLPDISKKEKNLIIYNNKELINLTSDDVTEDTLLFGYRCHKKDGTVINGNFLKNYPSSVTLVDNLLDSNGDKILDSNGNPIQTTIVYNKTDSGSYVNYTKA